MLDNENDIFSVVRVKDVLQKYKEIIGTATADETIKYIDNLEQQVKKQNEAINKIMEYINYQMIPYDNGIDSVVECNCDGFILLNILKKVK